MISLQNDPSAVLLKQYMPPFRGTWKTLPPHLLPDDVLQDSQNVTLLGGKLRSRLGHKSFSSIGLPGPIVGSFLFADVTGFKFVVASTATRLFTFYGGVWHETTGNPMGPATQVRMASIQIGKYVYMLYANGVNPLMYGGALGQLTPIIPVTGTVPILTDLCNSASRIVGVTPPYTVTWCDVLNNAFLSFTNWPALNQVVLSDTEDLIVAIRPIGTLGFAVYKEGNIFTGTPQSGPQSAAFRFDHRGEYQGPANANAIVNWNGRHIYMTASGRVGMFDGSQQMWIADGSWPFLQDTLDPAHTSSIFGVHNYLTSEITFYFSRLGDNGANLGMLVLNCPYPLAGVNDWAYYFGSCALAPTNGLSVRFYQNQLTPLIFSNSGGVRQTFILDKNTYQDDGTDYTCKLTTGLFKAASVLQQPAKGNHDIFRPTLELYATRDNTRGIAQLSVLTANSLETDGTVSQSEQLDLTQVRPNEFVGYDAAVQGSFLGVNLQWSSSAKVEYKGCDVYGRPTQ